MSFASAAITILLVLYPALVYLGLSYSRISAVAVLLIVISIGRLALRYRGINPLGASAPWISAGGILLAGTVLLRGSADAMLFYPMFVNLVLRCEHRCLSAKPTGEERAAKLERVRGVERPVP